MSGAASYSVKVTSVGHASGELNTDPGAQSIATSVGERQIKSLSSGNNTITVPTGATLCIIKQPTANAVALTLKGVNGDTGIALSTTLPVALTLASVSTFVLNAGGSVTLELTFY